jgi:demethylmacrocin O-methyltransferase
MMTFDEICKKHKADKATVHHVTPHGYAPAYDRTFSHFRNAEVNIMEIGVGSGESIRSWLEYFPNAHVYGVDLVHDTNEWNSTGVTPDPRYTFATGDQSDENFWTGFFNNWKVRMDAIIDDGSHMVHHVIPCFNALWPHVSVNGFYCIEDLACSYGQIFLRPGWPTHMDFIKAKLDDVHNSGAVKSFYMVKELAIFQKGA